MTEVVLYQIENVTITSRKNINYGGDVDMLMPVGGYVAAAVVLFLIGFFGFFLNLSVIVIMWKDKKLWTPLNIILFNLICSDFSVSILGNPWTLASALSYRWIFGPLMCELYGFFMSLLGITSITTLTVLAFERYLIVSRPLRNHGISRKEAMLLLIGIWLYSLSLTAPPLVGWGRFVTEAANISCSVNWEEQSYNAMTYIMYLFAGGLVLPLSVIIFSYAQIIVHLKKVIKNQISVGQTTKAEKRVTFMVLLMIVAYLIAWSPYALCALIIQFGDPSLITPAIGVVPALLAKSSICYNPIIYVGLNSQFRQTLKKTLGLKDRQQESNGETYALGVSKFVSTSFIENSPFRLGKFTTPAKNTKGHVFVFKDPDKRTITIVENGGENSETGNQV